jgi:hypothetical protein
MRVDEEVEFKDFYASLFMMPFSRLAFFTIDAAVVKHEQLIGCRYIYANTILRPAVVSNRVCLCARHSMIIIHSHSDQRGTVTLDCSILERSCAEKTV